jgi:hypothetical protein
MAELAGDHGSARQPLKRNGDQQQQAQGEATNRKLHTTSIHNVGGYANDKFKDATNKLSLFSARFCPMINTMQLNAHHNT